MENTPAAQEETNLDPTPLSGTLPTSTGSLFELMQPSKDKNVQYTHLCTQIDNILNSYDDEFDVFSEVIQNSVDAILEKCLIAKDSYIPRIDIHIDLKQNRLVVLDNGIGVKPDDFTSAIKPNESLKRRLRHKQARGEKGAALVFLQFGHEMFVFESKTPEGSKSYSLKNGRAWFKGVMEVMDSDGDFEEKISKFPHESYSMDEPVSPDLEALESGCQVTIEFGPNCRLSSLEELFGSDVNRAFNRAEHILRTRTAIGFIVAGDREDDLPDCLQNLQVNLTLTQPNEAQQKKTVPVGFHYPHLWATKRGSTSDLMTGSKTGNEILYDFIDIPFLKKYLPRFWNKTANRNIAEKYQVSGYFSYAYQNGYYEQAAGSEMGLDFEEIEKDEHYQLVQINGGFQLGVKNYPNGRRHAFLHRSGAEDKSRTYIVINFNGGYKPDYGRKNISGEVRPFVLDLCKDLISFAIQSDRKKRYKVGRAAAPHSVTSLRDARNRRKEEAKSQVALSIWLQSVQGPDGFKRRPTAEAELAAEFCHFVLSGRLPGFSLYGLPSRLQYDALFDYDIARKDEVVYSEKTRPLGIYFSEGETNHSFDEQWLEFKLSSDLLVDDLKKREGEDGKKYFVLVDLLVCDKVDSATDNYSISEITKDEEARQRSYYGVTHLMTSATDQSHVIQVICLQTLRKTLESHPEKFPIIEEVSE